MIESVIENAKKFNYQEGQLILLAFFIVRLPVQLNNKRLSKEQMTERVQQPCNARSEMKGFIQ